MAEAAITAVLSMLGELAVSETRILFQVGEDIELLRDHLEWLQAFVRDADRKRRAGTDELTLVLLSQTRRVAFDAEDALDEFFYDKVLGLNRQADGRVWKILHCLQTYFTCCCTQIVARHGFSDRIKIIKRRLDQLSQNKKEYSIEHTPPVVLSSSTTAIAAWRDDLENAVGFDKDVEILMEMLRKDQMFVMSIIGESGAGKNTLAKIICREMAALPEVEVAVWCHKVPGSFKEFIAQVVTRARAYRKCDPLSTRQRPWPNDEYKWMKPVTPGRTWQSGNELRRFLGQRKYLLILSGISSKNVLNCVMGCLPQPNRDKDNGSRVMLVLDTENEELAWHANTKNRNGINGVHVLSRLDQERSGQLFYWKVLRKGQCESNSKYLRLVHDITGGYPMAIVLLAGLLRFKEKPAQWDAVLQHLKSDCDQQANLRGTRRPIEIIFWASFEDLSNDLKSCYLYLVAYPGSFSHSADKIVRMWIAEGFIKPTEDGKTMEDLGHDYLKELILRCLVELDELKAGGGIGFVRVHKSLTGLLKSEAHEAGFMEIHSSDDTLIPPSVRRLAVPSGNPTRFYSTFDSKKFSNLRSFICNMLMTLDERDNIKFLLWSRFIRVISIQGLNLGELPDEIGDMINLRYLRIDSGALYQIPSSIARLLSLQTLDIRNTSVEKIDKDFWKIQTLRHVLADALELPNTVPLVLSKDGGARELQTLHGVCPEASAEWSEETCPLDKMGNLRSLEMHDFKHEKHGGTAFRSALKKMHLLGHLHIKGDHIPSYVLTHQNLQSLQTIVLHGSVNWDDTIKELPVVDSPLRMVRPNLVQLKLDDDAIREMPQSIREQLEGILIQEEGTDRKMGSETDGEMES